VNREVKIIELNKKIAELEEALKQTADKLRGKGRTQGFASWRLLR